jgi:hypothetical protein
LQAAKYFSHAHLYFIGKSWFTSARPLIIRFSSTLTRAAPRAMEPRPVASLSSEFPSVEGWRVPLERRGSRLDLNSVFTNMFSARDGNEADALSASSK